MLWEKSLDFAARETLLVFIFVKAVPGQSGRKPYKGLKEENHGRRKRASP